MVADNDFEALIDLLLLPIATLLDEQENGGKVSNLLDNKGNTNCNITLPYLECKSSMREVECREYRDIFSSSTTKQNAFATKPKGQSSEFHINANLSVEVRAEISTFETSISPLMSFGNNASRIAASLVFSCEFT